ncbi:MAG: putative ABC transporter permease [Oscillospiraceae bacterium]|nr:putative ABC transporter permease [Oscillospiraceae bacterium]
MNISKPCPCRACAGMQGHRYINFAICKLAEFLVCAFIGWCYEVLLTWAVLGVFIDRGLLSIPICPIYGIGALLMGEIVSLSGTKRVGGIFLVCAVSATVLELASSYVIEAILGHGLWSYRDWCFNFEGRISLFSSLIFGGMGVLFIKVIRPGIKAIGRKGQ